MNLITDASNVSIAGILRQGPIGDRSVAYISRTLDSEEDYSTIEKELLAIVWATTQCR